MPAKRDEVLWVTRVQGATLCGVGERQFDKVIPGRLKADGSRGKGRALRYYAPAVVAALVEYRTESAKPAPIDGDPDMTGPPGDWLERYRQVKTELARLDKDERVGQLARVDALRRAMAAGVGAMRATGDRLTRQHGNDAGEQFNEAVADFEAAALKALKEEKDVGRNDAGPGAGGRHADAATADVA